MGILDKDLGNMFPLILYRRNLGVCVRLSEITQSTHTSGSDIGRMTSDAVAHGDGVVLMMMS